MAKGNAHSRANVTLSLRWHPKMHGNVLNQGADIKQRLSYSFCIHDQMLLAQVDMIVQRGLTQWLQCAI
jgi:hypothetical protein